MARLTLGVPAKFKRLSTSVSSHLKLQSNQSKHVYPSYIVTCPSAQKYAHLSALEDLDPGDGGGRGVATAETA